MLRFPVKMNTDSGGFNLPAMTSTMNVALLSTGAITLSGVLLLSWLALRQARRVRQS